MASSLQTEWIFHELSPEHGIVRVISVSPTEAAAIPNAQEQATRLYEALFERAGHPVVHAKKNVDRAFVAPEGAAAAAVPPRNVFAYVDPSPSTRSDTAAAFCRVSYDGENIVIWSAAIDNALSEAEAKAVAHAITSVTDDIALHVARGLLEKSDKTDKPAMIWRGQLGASDELKKLFDERGYSVALADRLEMTAEMKDVDAGAEVPVPSGLEVRALDLANDDLVAVYSVLTMAFGPHGPPFAIWKQHYAEQPRFAADMSFVAWENDKPVAVSVIELIVDGEGGGDEEVMKVHQAAAQLSEAAATTEVTDLQFPDDYEERKTKIRAAADTGYVCGIATVPEMRGKGLARTLLRHNFRAAARAGLSKIYLGTDRQNPAAVRAYERAGMAVTKVESHGMVTIKAYKPEP